MFNAISVKGDAIGDVMFYGRGAGKLPTASAVVADVMDAAKHLKTKKYISWAEGGPDAVYSIDEVKNRWYVRTKVDTAAPEGAQVLSTRTTRPAPPLSPPRLFPKRNCAPS